MEDTRCNLYMHREAQAWAPKKKRLPVTLVTGFLGAGKTTLLTHILSNKHNLKIAAAVNDFAALNIDGQIVRGTGRHDEVVELSNGCLCCSVSGEFRKAVWQLLQDADIGKIDYLVVETSGITDPYQTIATLEQDYGQMYRVRLDVVVTVVDTDALVANLTQQDKENILDSVAADSQLQCTDVVLLNKKDLVSDEHLQKAKDFIASLIPGVRVYACNRCAVPLNWIMEVSEVGHGPQVVSHEVTAAAYTISTEGGVKNVERHKRDVGSKNKHSNHLLTDEFCSLVFESSTPFRLEKFQFFLGAGFPTGLVRMKGSVWFEEYHCCLYSFHMSGRYRYEFTPQATHTTDKLFGAFKVELVAIGKDMDIETVRSALKDCTSKIENSDCLISSQEQSQYLAVCELVKKHDYFVLEEQDKEGLFVDFRVTGCIDYGVSEEEAAGFHGINFTRMNEEVAKRVNGSCYRVSLLPVMSPSGVQVCRHGLSEFEEMWKVVQDVAEKVVAEFYRAVGVCKCGR